MKIEKFDPLLDHIKKTYSKIYEDMEEDPDTLKYFCTNWDLCVEKLKELRGTDFIIEIEQDMHEYSKNNPETFWEYFCAPYLLAELIEMNLHTDKCPF